MIRRTLASILFIGTLAAGAPMAAAQVYVNIAPPPPRVEVKVVAPGPGYVWIGGYHRWAAGAYVCGSRAMGEAAPRRSRLDPGPLEEHAPRLGLEERPLALTVPASTRR